MNIAGLSELSIQGGPEKTRVIQIYLGNFKHDNFTSATKFSCSLSQKQSITGKNFEIGLHLGLVLARQSFST